MRVRSLLIAGIALAAGLVLFRLAHLEAATRERAVLESVVSHANVAARHAAGLLALAQEYLARESPRAARQWRATHAELTATLADGSTPHATLRSEFDDLRKVSKGLPGLFDAVVATSLQTPRDTSRRELLADHLLTETTRISDGAFVLIEEAAALRHADDVAEARVTRLTMASFGALVLLIAAVIGGRVLRPMARLDGAAQAIRGGAADARSRYRARDEFGNLSASFDAMAQALQERSAGLEAARAELLGVLDMLPSVIGYWDHQQCNRFANKLYLAWFGLDAEQMDGITMRELLGERYEVSRPHVEAALAGQAQVFERMVQRPDGGGERHLLLHFIPDVVDGEVRGFYSCMFDVTEQVRARERLQANERFLRQITDGLPMRIAYVDADRRFRFVNAAHCARFGRPREQILGRTRGELKGGEPGESEQRLAEALQGHEQRFEFEEALAEGQRCFESRMVPDRDAQGRVVGVVTSGIDITDRKRAELELMATSSLLRTVLESASEVSIIATDPQLLIQVFNTGAERMLGYTAAEVVDRTTPILIHDAEQVQARAQEMGERLGRPVAGGQVFVEPSVLRQPREWTYVRKDGSRVLVSLVVTAMHRSDGELLGYLGIAHDVTRQKQAEESLRLAMQKARHASRAKSQFLANMSHEIRTPMNAVIGLTYLLGQTALDDEQAVFLAKIGTASRSLLTLINDVLDLSKVEAGELTIENAPFELRQLLHEVTEVAAVQADAKGVGFEVDAPATLPAVLVGDPMRLNQVLLNLLSNAIKFTERGKVLLTVRALQATADHARLRLTVSDSGIGIAPDMQDRLFKPFVQGDASTTRRFGGTGLGLSIVKTLVELMGGEVGLRSKPGVGSEFIVEIDFALAAAEAAPSDMAALPADEGLSLHGVRVLVVDDSEINLDVARRILELEGAVVALAANGLIACEMLRADPAGCDIVLMDVQMPVLDGYAATRRIRRELGLTELPILALTAGALTSERERAAEAGMNDFVTKPFAPRSLIRTLRARLLPEARLRAAHPAVAAPRGGIDASGWPAIEGIDGAEVHERLGGDLPLFRTMLERLLGEFTPPLMPADRNLRDLAGRMHKLRGAAGMLGAKSIQQTAADAEAACRAEDAPAVSRLARRLETRLLRLGAAVRPMLDAALAEARRDPSGPPVALDLQAVDGLCNRLREHSLAAIDCFEGAAAGLRNHLGQAAFEDLRAHVNNLRYSEALQLLQRETASCRQRQAA